MVGFYSSTVYIYLWNKNTCTCQRVNKVSADKDKTQTSLWWYYCFGSTWDCLESNKMHTNHPLMPKKFVFGKDEEIQEKYEILEKK